MLHKTLYIFLLIIFFNQANAQKGKTFVLKNDTIHPDFKKCDVLSSKIGYRNYGKIYISKNYRIIDSIHLKKGNYLLLVLSPITQDFDDTLHCKIDIKRIFLLLKCTRNVNKIQYISDDLILNTFDSQSEPYIKGIKAYQNGFELSFCVGSKIRCDLNLYFKSLNQNFYLEKVRTNYYTTDLRKTKNQTLYFNSNKYHELNNIRTLRLLKFPDW